MTVNMKTISGVDFRVINELDPAIMEEIERHIITPTVMGFSLIGTPYQHLGEGSFGAVYGVTDEIAVKVAFDPDDKAEDGKALEDLQGLPYIVKLYAYSEDNRFTIMQRIKGQTVGSWSINPTFKVEKFNVTQESLRKFYYEAKKRGRTPQDCHMYNSMVDKDGNYWIVDLGFYRPMEYGDHRALLNHVNVLENCLRHMKPRERAPQEIYSSMPF